MAAAPHHPLARCNVSRSLAKCHSLFFFSCLNAIQVVIEVLRLQPLHYPLQQSWFVLQSNAILRPMKNALYWSLAGEWTTSQKISEIVLLRKVRSTLNLSPAFLFFHLHTNSLDSTATHPLSPDQLHFSTGQALERELSRLTPPALPCCAGGGSYRRLSAHAEAQLTIISLVVFCRLTYLHERKVVS